MYKKIQISWILSKHRLNDEAIQGMVEPNILYQKEAGQRKVQVLTLFDAAT